jgi:hypothetical protein
MVPRSNPATPGKSLQFVATYFAQQQMQCVTGLARTRMGLVRASPSSHTRPTTRSKALE